MRALIPNIVTSLNLLCGCIALTCIFIGEIILAPIFVVVAMILDFFDGFIARMLGVNSELGKQMDSLADIISFGLVPGAIVFQLINAHYYFIQNPPSVNQFHFEILNQVRSINGWEPFLGFLIPIFSAFRLAKFNIDTEQSEGFKGLNTPTNALLYISFPLMLWAYPKGINTLIEYNHISWILLTITIITSILLVTRIPMFSLKFKTFGWKHNEIRITFLCISTILILLELIGGLYFLSMPLIVFLYLSLSMVSNFILKNNDKI